MRRWKQWLAAAAVLAAVAVGAAALLRQATGDPGPGTPDQVSSARDFPVLAVSSGAEGGLALKGRVLDGAGQPVPNAEVRLAASAQTSLLTERCDFCGAPLLSCTSHHTVDGVAAWLRAGKGGLVPALSTRADQKGEFRFERLLGVSFTVWAQAPGLGVGGRERAAPGETTEIYLPRLRSIAGVVTDDDGRPVPQARVVALSRRLPLVRAASSGADGRFELSELGEGPFYVLADAPGFMPVASPQVEAGPQPVRMTLWHARALEVSVTRNGKPAEAQVRVEADHLQRAASTKSGSARFEHLAKDRITVTASAPPLGSLPATVELDDELTRVRLELEEGGTLQVTAVDEAGQPVPGVRLELVGPSNDRIGERRPQTGELASFGPLAPGSYLLRATAEGYKAAELPARVKVGETALEIVLAKAVQISGRVLDEYDRPAPGVSVLIAPTGDSVTADREGRFAAQVPSPGLYQLHAHHSDWGGGELQVTAPAVDVQLRLEPRASAEITVSAEGRRLEGAHAVLLTDGDSSFRSDRPSGADGRVVMRGLPAGAYTLLATHPDYLSSERLRITLTDGATLAVAVELGAGAAVAGTVLDTTGIPVSGAAVSVVPRGAEPAVTDGTGRFELKPLRPQASYRLAAIHPAFDQLEPVVAVAGGPPVRVVLERRKLFSGRVLSEEGAPVRHFRVDEHDVDSVDGRFRVPLGSVEGRVIVVIESSGFEPLVVDRPSSPELGDLVLTRSPEFTGDVKDASGSPVADAVVTCDVCEQSVLSGADGRFRLSTPHYAGKYVVSARKGSYSATQATSASAQAPVHLVLQLATRVSGSVFLADGRPALGVQLEATNFDRLETFSVVTGADGRYAVELPSGSYRFAVDPMGRRATATDLSIIVAVAGPQLALDLGPAPGTVGLAVRVRPERGYGLWVVRGELASVDNPPMELLRSGYAQLVYSPPQERVSFDGLLPGRYTLVYAGFHMESAGGALLQMVDVPASQEIVLSR